MIYEYAIDPDLLGRADLYRALRAAVGMSEGRLVSQFPKNWARRAYDAVIAADVGDIEKARMKAAIERLKRAPVAYRRHGYTWRETATWLDNALTEQKRCAFRAIVSTTPKPGVGDESGALVDFETVDPHEARWLNPSGVSIERIPQAMIECVAPVLDLAREVRFIDPHFRVAESRYKDPLRGWLSRIAERPLGGKIPELEYHVCDVVDRSFYQASVVHDLAALVPNVCELRVVYWPKAKMHNRFILTDIGGLHFGHGLDAWKEGQPDRDQVHRLPETVWAELWAQYSAGEVVCTVEKRV